MNFEKLVLAVVIVSVILNPIFAFFSIPAYFPSLILLFFFILIRHQNILFKRIGIISISYFLVVYFYDFVFIYKDLSLGLGTFTLILPFISVTFLQELVKKERSLGLAEFSGKIVFYSISILSIITLFTLFQNPLAARGLFENAGTSALLHSFVGFYFLPLFVVIPFLSKNISDLFWYKFIVFFSVLSLLISGLSTALFILVLCIGGIIFLKSLNKSIIFRFFIFVLFLVIIVSYQNLIDSLIGFLPTELQQIKKDEISNVDYNNFTDFLETYRYGVYFESWRSFIENPIFGKSNATFGHHSSILDKMGIFGLFGTFIFIAIYYLLNSNIKTVFNSKIESRYFNFTQFILLLSLCLNPLDIYYTQFFYFFSFFLPVSIKYITSLRGFVK
jgi:hypothetical protein